MNQMLECIPHHDNDVGCMAEAKQVTEPQWTGHDLLVHASNELTSLNSLMHTMATTPLIRSRSSSSHTSNRRCQLGLLKYDLTACHTPPSSLDSGSQSPISGTVAHECEP